MRPTPNVLPLEIKLNVALESTRSSVSRGRFGVSESPRTQWWVLRAPQWDAEESSASLEMIKDRLNLFPCSYPKTESITFLLSKTSSCGQLGEPHAARGQEETQNMERAINLCLPTTGLWHFPCLSFSKGKNNT